MVLPAAPLPEEVWMGRSGSSAQPQAKSTTEACSLESAADLTNKCSVETRVMQRAGQSAAQQFERNSRVECSSSVDFLAYPPWECLSFSPEQPPASEAAAISESGSEAEILDNWGKTVTKSTPLASGASQTAPAKTRPETMTEGKSVCIANTFVNSAPASSSTRSPLKFPYHLIKLPDERQKRVISDFPGLLSGVQRVNWFTVAATATDEDFQKFYNQSLREGDIWMCSPPKCGSMWTQELVWLLEHDLDFQSCQAMLYHRWHFNESSFVADLQQRHRLAEEHASSAKTSPSSAPSVPENKADYQEENASSQTPRFIKSHMPVSLWPPRLLDTCRVIYVARNPKDLCVSLYNHARRYKMLNFRQGLDVFAEHFLAGTIPATPVIPHMIEAWNIRHHPNMCFIFYEDLKSDLRGQIHRLCAFLGRQYSDREVDRLADYLHIDNFKQNPWRSQDFGKNRGVINENEGEFIRTGKVGDWKNHMTQEMSDRFDRWLEDELRATDLRFTLELLHQD